MATHQISIPQIKAARALLSWNQIDLANAAGISLPAVAKLESGLSQPRIDTLNALRSAFEQNGIEFLDSPGVQMRKEAFHVDVMYGRDGIYRMWADIETSMANGGELLISSVNETYWIDVFADRFWATLKRRHRLGIKPRLLVREGDLHVIGGPDTYIYRSIPETVFSSTAPHFIYLDKMGIVQIQPTLQVILIESRAIADTFRAVFEHNWNNGKELPKQGLIVLNPPDESSHKKSGR